MRSRITMTPITRGITLALALANGSDTPVVWLGGDDAAGQADVAAEVATTMGLTLHVLHAPSRMEGRRCRRKHSRHVCHMRCIPLSTRSMRCEMMRKSRPCVASMLCCDRWIRASGK